jgi:phosphoserine phosphatase RsbU/P
MLSYVLSPAGALLLVCLAMLAVMIVLMHRIGRMRRERNRLLAEKDLVFSFVYDIGEVFAESDTVELAPLVKRVLSFALKTARGSSGAIYLMEPDHKQLSAAAVAGVFPPLVGGVDDELDEAFSKVRHVERLVRAQTAKVGEGLIGGVAGTNASLILDATESDSRLPEFRHEFLRVHSLLLVPMRFRHEVLGVLAIANRVDGDTFGATDASLLQALADQASVTLHYARVSSTLDEKRRLDYDLMTAKNIQTALLPKVIPALPGAELAAFSVPAQQIGGDFYDFVEIDATRIGIAIADVSGKGVAGGLVMAICRTVLRVVAPGQQSPAAVLRRVNHALREDIGEDMFVSMLYMVLNTCTRQLTIARAGHMPPIICPPHPREPWEPESPGIAVGLGDMAFFDSVLEDRTIQLSAHDMVVIYTDGVTEAQDRRGNEWGKLNLAKTIQMATGDSEARAVVRTVRQNLLHFVGDVPQYDDMTLVALKILGEPHA